MATWLSGYSKRIKLTVDNTNIDDTLSNFPVLVKISNNSGISSTDVTSVFTELGSDANRKKIAVTTSNGETQCYVEIERFDYSNSVAWLWVKVPSVDSGAGTDLYLYYDSDQADNTTYVGDTGDASAQSVWDSNFKLVMHMAQDPNGDVADAIKDSTSNANHGTPAGTMTSTDLVDGKIGKAIDFDGDNDFIDVGDVTILDAAVACTFELILNRTSFTSDGGFIRKWATGQQSFSIGQATSDDQITMLINDTGAVNPLSGTTTNATIANSVLVYIVGIWNGGNTLQIIENTVSRTINYAIQNTPVSIANTTEHLSLNARYNAGIPDKFTNSITDEVRISNIARSAAWIKATYYSNWDELVNFGSEEEKKYYVEGYVTEVGNSVVRTVRLYDTATGELQAETTSSGINGYYYLEATTIGSYYAVCLDDEAGQSYNHLILKDVEWAEV